MAATSEIHGWTASGWEGVRDAFARNFAEGSESGAAFAAYHDGRQVVDLCGGVANDRTGQPWVEDTLIPVYSTTKGATAVCANRLTQQGRLDLDAPVAEYWPEFAAAGKGEIPVRWLLCHKAGLPYIDGPMTAEQAFAWDPVIEALAAQAPVWEPGTAHGYHATTYGYLVGEVVRRITGLSLGTFLRQEIAGPLGLDFWIGLPESEEHRVGRLAGVPSTANPAGQNEHDNSAEAQARGAEQAAALAALMGPDTLIGKSLGAPGGAFDAPGIWNSRAMHAAEVPAANGITDARSLARLYAACLGDVTDTDGTTVPRILDADQLKHASAPETDTPDVVLFDLDIQFGLGFMVHGPLLALGCPGSFGHFGMGGSVGWADPERGLAVGYTMNRMSMGMTGDLRSLHLLGACHHALAASA